MFAAWFGRFVRSDNDDRTPVGINVAVGAAVVAAATAVATWLAPTDTAWRCVLLAVALGVFAAVTVDPPALVVLLLPAWLIMNGFLVNRLGILSWHGTPDVYRFLLLAVGGSSGLAVGQFNRRVRDLRERWELGAMVQTMSDGFEKETSRNA